jgi:transcriptional regulator with XRE-family HTH domain
VDNRVEVRDFLTTRRARLTPQRAGLTAFSSNRRVPGLKRGEVADLAGVSVEYYSQLERGNLAGSPTSCSIRSPAPCNWTRPNAST